MCSHIATSNPDTVLICFRARTGPVIDLDLFYAPVRPHAKRERPPEKKIPKPRVFFFLRQTQGCRRGKCEYMVGESKQGTLEQLVWIIRGVG